MIVAVIAVRMMQMPIDQIVDVIAMRNRLVSATGTMHMTRRMTRARVLRRAGIRVLRRDVDRVLVHVSGMHVVQVPIVQIVHVIAVLHGGVPAPGTMLMGVIGVMGQFAVGHCALLVEASNLP